MDSRGLLIYNSIILQSLLQHLAAIRRLVNQVRMFGVLTPFFSLFSVISAFSAILHDDWMHLQLRSTISIRMTEPRRRIC